MLDQSKKENNKCKDQTWVKKSVITLHINLIKIYKRVWQLHRILTKDKLSTYEVA